MGRRKLPGWGLLALVAPAAGFVLAGQVRTQLLTPSNQVARYQALIVRTIATCDLVAS